MIYKFRIISDENDKFSMEIEIKSSQTFFDFHSAIQDEAEWDNSQLASFFLCNNLWEKEQEVSLLDMSDGENTNTIVMDKAIIEDYIKDLKQKLIYIFDFFNERFFYIELVDIKSESQSKYYPVCTSFKGDLPPQIKMSKTKSSKNLFAGEYEEETYDELGEEDLGDDLEKNFDDTDYIEGEGDEEEKY